MPSKPLLSWPKRQLGPETSPRTGGLLPSLKRQASKLVPQSSDDKQNVHSPGTNHYSAVLANAIGNLHTVVNDILCSPASTGTCCSSSSSVHEPPRSRPLSLSAPLVAELPAELPDPTFLENKDHSSPSTPVLTTPTVKVTHDESQEPNPQPDYEEVILDTSQPASPRLAYSRSVLHLDSRYSSRKTNRDSKIPVADDTLQSGSPKMKRNHSFNAYYLLRKHRDSDTAKPLSVFTRNDFAKRDINICHQEAERRQSYIAVVSSSLFLSRAFPLGKQEYRTTKCPQNVSHVITTALGILPSNFPDVAVES